MNRTFASISAALLIAAGACSRGGGDNEAAVAPANRNGAGSEGQGPPQDAAAIMKARHDRYEEMGRALKGIGDQLKAGSPDLTLIRRHSATIAGYAPQVPGWFPPGSGPETGRRTRAKAEIWTDPAAFAAAVERLQQAAAAFDQAAQAGNLDQIRAALPALRSSCSNCHDRFRGPEIDDH